MERPAGEIGRRGADVGDLDPLAPFVRDGDRIDHHARDDEIAAARPAPRDAPATGGEREQQESASERPHATTARDYFFSAMTASAAATSLSTVSPSSS